MRSRLKAGMGRERRPPGGTRPALPFFSRSSSPPYRPDPVTRLDAGVCAMVDAQDRQPPASERKIHQARAEGEVTHSRDLAHFAAVGAGLALLALAPGLLEGASRALSFDAHAAADPQALVDRLSGLALAEVDRTQTPPIRAWCAHELHGRSTFHADQPFQLILTMRRSNFLSKSLWPIKVPAPPKSIRSRHITADQASLNVRCHGS
ncbi:MAG: EscU/YscU/HrcU family type III secretion system export apparatus switch protein [Pseudomonas sp.]